MKKRLILISLLTSTLGFSQIDFAKQVKKKDMSKVVFINTTDNSGNTSIGFLMDGKPVGPRMVLNTSGTTEYFNYNKNNDIDGTYISMDKTAGETTLYTYRKNKKEGPAFKLATGKVQWHKQFENDEATGKEYKVNHTFDYYSQNNGAKLEGFTMEKYKNSYALGYFAYGLKAYPIIHVWTDGDSYYGQCIQGERKEFGVFFNSDGGKYVGAWHKNNREGLGFVLDKNGTVIEKGFYDNGKLIISL